MQSLKKGDLILISVPERQWKNAKAKFIKTNKEGNKLNVYCKGVLTWVPSSAYEGKAESFFKSKTKQKQPQKKQEQKTVSVNAMNILAFIKDNPHTTKEKISDLYGLSEMAVDAFIKNLINKGLVKCDVSNAFKLEALKQESDLKVKEGVKSLPSDKPVKVTRKERILKMHIEGKSIKEISEIINSSPTYVREIIQIDSPNFKEPKEGTDSYKVMTELKKGISVKEVMSITGKSYTLVNKIKNRLKSAQLI